MWCVFAVDQRPCVRSGPIQYKVTAVFTFRVGSESVGSEVHLAVTVDASLHVYSNACYCACLALLGSCPTTLYSCTGFHVIP